MDNIKQTEELINKYLAGECTAEETILVERFYLSQFIKEPFPEISERDIKAELSARLFNEVIPEPAVLRKRNIASLWRYSAAAAILVAISVFGIHFYNNQKNNLKPNNTLSEIVPGGNRAVLTLGNGNKIFLNNRGNGQLAIQSGVAVKKANDGTILYESDKNSKGADIATLYNTIETPAGGQYKVILPDGTKVWLNALSSLRYPVVFAGDTRQVVLTGEGYFEVAHDKDHPFFVQSSGQSIRVLGTHFNVNSYQDEPVNRTTLLEGRIKISIGSSDKILIPGEQASVTNKQIQVTKADPEESVAWKNGDFVFEQAPLSMIMRQISRWYDVKVICGGDVGNIKLSGSISRSKSLKEVLTVLEITEAVHFKIKERSVLVMP
ncbi:FecR family protein [Mucilaginibacter psychrotolerans]|nr:FecR domain-containing protein [Mucilaginibacter psychrotolerans]